MTADTVNAHRVTTHTKTAAGEVANGSPHTIGRRWRDRNTAPAPHHLPRSHGVAGRADSSLSVRALPRRLLGTVAAAGGFLRDSRLT